MAKVHGRTALPLPESLGVALTGLGYLRLTDEPGKPTLFRHPEHPTLFLEVTRGNVPGSDALIARWFGQSPTRLKVELLIARLTLQLHEITAANRFMERGSDND